MSRPPAFQFYADDFLGGVSDMTQDEVGAYMLLLCHQWNKGGIPLDPARAALIAKGDVSAHVLAKFPDGKNVRLELERQKQADYREKQANKGRASAQARFNRGSTVVQPTPEPSHQPDNQPKGNSPFPSPSPENTNPLTPLQGELIPPASPLPKDEKPKGPLQLRAERLMRRRESTPLTHAETRAFTKNRAAIEATTEEEWLALERFYAAPQSLTFARKNLAQLINNWNGEIDQAKAWMGQSPAGTPVPKLKYV